MSPACSRPVALRTKLTSNALFRGCGLPEERHEAEAGAETIFGVAGQFSAKNLFLIEQAENHEWDEKGKDG